MATQPRLLTSISKGSLSCSMSVPLILVQVPQKQNEHERFLVQNVGGLSEDILSVRLLRTYLVLWICKRRTSRQFPKLIWPETFFPPEQDPKWPEYHGMIFFGTCTDINGTDILQERDPLEMEVSSLGCVAISAKGMWAGHPRCLLCHTFNPTGQTWPVFPWSLTLSWGMTRNQVQGQGLGHLHGYWLLERAEPSHVKSGNGLIFFPPSLPWHSSCPWSLPYQVGSTGERYWHTPITFRFYKIWHKLNS